MKPPCPSLARRTKSGSSFMNVYSAMAATLDRSAMTIAPSGAIEPVETLSGRTIRTCPVMSSGSGGGIGGGLMLGPRIGNPAVQPGGCRGRRRGEVDLVVGRAGAALEVAVEGAHARLAGRRRLADADTRPAGRLQDPHAGPLQPLQDPRAGDRREDLAAAGRNRADRGRGQVMAVQDRGGDRQVLVPGVHARPEAHLEDRLAGDLIDRDDVVRLGRLGAQRLERAEVEV